MKKSRVAFLGLFTAFAMILSFVESQIPSPMNGVIPGVKLGLPNIAIIIVLVIDLLMNLIKNKIKNAKSI